MGTAWERQGNGMGTAWERHDMCESALKGCLGRANARKKCLIGVTLKKNLLQYKIKIKIKQIKIITRGNVTMTE
jgi:hypothetical protein